MASPSALIRGLVSRALPILGLDGPDSEKVLRLKRYGDVGTESLWPTDHVLADEGSVFVASMAPGATAIQLGLSASFSATAAAFVIANGDAPNGKRVYLKWLKLMQSVAPTSGVDLRYAIVTDTVTRIPTTISNATGASQGPGTPATATAYRAPAVCVNSDVSDRAPVAIPYFPLSASAGAPPTVPAAGPNARTIEGNGYIKNSIPVVKDQYVLQFGSADIGGSFQSAAALAKIVEHAPPVIIGPGCSAVIHIWSASNITAGNAWDGVSLCWAER